MTDKQALIIAGAIVLGLLLLALLLRDNGRFHMIVGTTGQRYLVDTRTGTTWFHKGSRMPNEDWWEKEDGPTDAPLLR